MPIFYRHYSCRTLFVSLAALVVALAVAGASAQSVGNSGSINGSVLDPTGAVVAGAKVKRPDQFRRLPGGGRLQPAANREALS